MVKQCNGEIKFSVIFYQIIRNKLVPNYQINSKNIFGRKKRNGPITSTSGPIINLTNSSQNIKSVQIYWPCIQEGKDIERVADTVWVIFVRIMSVQYISYVSLQSFMSSELSVKEFSCQQLLNAALFHMRSMITPAALFHICSKITLQLLPNCSPITPQSSYASVYPPSFYTLEWMEMQIGLPLFGQMKLFHRTHSLPQRLQN